MKRFRESFGAKLLAALLGTVGLLLLVTSLVVRSVTSQQVDAVVARASATAAGQFRELEAIQQQQLAAVTNPLAGGVRTLAALDEAVQDGDRADLLGVVQYELTLAHIRDVVLAFTDPRGRPVLSLHDDKPLGGDDPLGVQGLAREMLAHGDVQRRGYRVLDGRLFAVRMRLIQLGGRVVGTFTSGLPVEDANVEDIGAALGVQVCVVVGDRCVAATKGIRSSPPLGAALVRLSKGSGARRVHVGGEAWSVRAQPLVSDDPSEGVRVVAVPLSPVTAPFRRINQALLLGGALALLVATLLAMGLARGLTRPIRALVAAAGRVAQGDYEAEVGVTSRDEIGRLAGAFNDMTRGLRLKERYRSVLDKVVSRDVAEQLVEGGVELGGENRRVTVLFGDIRGFTALTEGMVPQKVITLLNECMQRLSDAIDEEGGVVDKFVGDEIMAVFGAPVRQEDHAARAVRAALRMRESVAGLNRERQARGEDPIGLGVGINTGDVVAGNMGSKNRLNYTVLGEMVNLASRLCGGAAAGEILMTEGTLRAAGEGVRARSLGGRPFKGFSDDVEVFALDGAVGPAGEEGRGITEEGADVGAGQTGRASDPERPRGPRRPPRAGGALLLALVAVLALPPAVSAQGGGWPTLSDAGLGYFGSGTMQMALSGELDLETFHLGGPTAGLVTGDGWLEAPRLRLMTDMFVGDRVYGLVELRGDRGEAPTQGEWHARVEQAFLRVSSLKGTVSLQAGRFASPFGSYAARHLTRVDPFVRPPLPYDDRTVISRSIAPPSTAVFLGWQDKGDTFRRDGAPPVWGVPYQWGAMIAGRVRQVSYRVAAMNGAPSSEPRDWGLGHEGFRHPSWVAGMGVQVTPSLALGGSWDRGPFMQPLTKGSLPAGRHRYDYAQELLSFDASFARGPVMARGEVIHDRWQVPNLSGTPVDVGYSLAVQSDVGGGWSAAARWGYLDFRPLGDGAGGRRPWDHPVARYEASLSYRMAKNAGLMGSYGITHRTSADRNVGLFALRLWWTF